jgi:hypothetical protein
VERYRTTIILLVVLVALAGLAFFVNRGGNTPSPLTTPTTNTVYVWQETSPIVAIQVVSATGSVSLTKNTETTVWSIREPISDTADPIIVGNLVDTLQNLSAQSELTGTTDLAEFGLAGQPLSVTFTFSSTDGMQRTLLIGDASPDGSTYYVKRADTPNVFLVSNFTLEPLRSWLTMPPKAQPTPTPIPVTIVPTSAITSTLGATGTQTLTGTLPITNTLPGAANPTTPLVPTTAPVTSPSP